MCKWHFFWKVPSLEMAQKIAFVVLVSGRLVSLVLTGPLQIFLQWTYPLAHKLLASVSPVVKNCRTQFKCHMKNHLFLLILNACPHSFNSSLLTALKKGKHSIPDNPLRSTNDFIAHSLFSKCKKALVYLLVPHVVTSDTFNHCCCPFASLPISTNFLFEIGGQDVGKLWVYAHIYIRIYINMYSYTSMSLYSTMSSLLVSIVFLIVLNGFDFWLFLISEMCTL